MTNNMAKIKLTEALSGLVAQAPRQELLDLIMSRIIKKKILAIRLKIASTAAGLFGASLYLALNWQAIVSDLAQSAIWQLPRLLVSDFGAVLANWQDYGWYAIESLPLFSIAALTLMLWLILESIKFASELSNINKYKLKI